MITLGAPAKLNLYLHVTGRRDDGYHLLDSLVVFPPGLSDTIMLESADSLSFSARGNMPEDARGMDNLAVKAAQALARLAGRSPDVHITIQKNIPAGAGLGGGSADAAATIKGLERLWGVSLSAKERRDLLLSLGADVPACYHAKPCRFEGIGEIISDVPALPRFSFLLIWPDCHTATKNVFSARTQPFRETKTKLPPSFGNLDYFLGFLEGTGNDLQAAAESLSPAIAAARAFLQRQEGCRMARMSGSGSCMFGIFEDPSLCKAAQGAIKSQHPNWWTHTDAL